MILKLHGMIYANFDLIFKWKMFADELQDSLKFTDDALKFLTYMVEVNILCDVALGTYDLKLALMVAEKSQKVGFIRFYFIHHFSFSELFEIFLLFDRDSIKLLLYSGSKRIPALFE